MPVIRSATVADESAVTGLWKACGLMVPYNDPVEDFRRALGKAGSDVLIAIDAGQIIGSVMVGHDGHRGWLYYVAVDPARRMEGVGKAVIEAAEAWLRLRGIPKAMLLVRETNTQVSVFYENLGFETSPRVVMQKWLQP